MIHRILCLFYHLQSNSHNRLLIRDIVSQVQLSSGGAPRAVKIQTVLQALTMGVVGFICRLESLAIGNYHPSVKLDIFYGRRGVLCGVREGDQCQASQDTPEYPNVQASLRDPYGAPDDREQHRDGPRGGARWI